MFSSLDRPIQRRGISAIRLREGFQRKLEEKESVRAEKPVGERGHFVTHNLKMLDHCVSNHYSVAPEVRAFPPCLLEALPDAHL